MPEKDEAIMEWAEKTVKDHKDFNIRMDEVKLFMHRNDKVKDDSLPCIGEFTCSVDIAYIFPIKKNNTPASIAEAIVKRLRRRY